MANHLLLLETGTRRAVIGLAAKHGELQMEVAWDSAHRHGEELLPRLRELFATGSRDISAIEAVAVGTGPGSFTGLRIGMATAKVIAYTLGVPIIGLSTTQLLATALGEEGTVAVVLPAGVGDRYVSRYEAAAAAAIEVMPPALVPAGRLASALRDGDLVLSVDLEEGELGPSTASRGRQAQERLGAAMASVAADAHAARRWDDPATLVPRYVALPRGIPVAAQEVAWSPDLR